MTELEPIAGNVEPERDRRWWHCPHCRTRWASALQCVVELRCPECKVQWVWFQKKWVDPAHVNPPRIRLLMEG